MRILPDAAAYPLLAAQLRKTAEVAMLPVEEAAMASATVFRFGPQEQGIAFEWGSGPLVILVHGWGGRAAQMAPLAALLASKGYRSVALEIPGHGSPGRRSTRWNYFLRDIEAVTKALRSEVFAYAGHSSGGTTMMAARRNGLIRASLYICICSPSYPFLSVDAARNIFNASDGVVERYKLHLAEAFGISWNELEAGGSYAGAGNDLLLVYAGKDRMVPHHEGDGIHALCTGSALFKTTNYGHRSILSAPELYAEVLSFLKR